MRLIATSAALDAFRDAQVGASVNVSYFKIGEGGWMHLNGATVPREPDPVLTDLDCLENPDRYPVGSRHSYRKGLEASDIVHTVAGEITIACELDLGEGNDVDDIDPPKYFEIGVFTDTDVMMYYATFPQFTKRSDRVFHLDLTIRYMNAE